MRLRFPGDLAGVSMCRRAFVVAVAAVVLILTGSVARGANVSVPPLPVRIDGTSIVSTSTSGSKVLFVGCARRASNFASRVALYTDVVQTASNGEARYPVPVLGSAANVPRDSFWIAADLQTGQYGTVAPAGTPLRLLTTSRGSLPKSNNGQLQKFVASISYAQIVLIRPGVGAWMRSIGDGGPHDRDGINDGKIETGPDDMTPIGTTSAESPKKFDNGDIVILIDQDSMSFLATRVGEK